MDTSITSFPLLRFDDTIDVNRNKRGFIETVYRYASANDVRVADVNKKQKKEEKRRKGLNRARRRYDRGNDENCRRENDRREVFYFVM